MKPGALLLIVVLAGCVGCTTIRIVDKNDAVSIERHFGVAAINVAPDAGAVSTYVASLGYLASPGGHAFGFTRQSITSTDDGCRVIVWVDKSVDRDQLVRSLESVESACFVDQ